MKRFFAWRPGFRLLAGYCLLAAGCGSEPFLKAGDRVEAVLFSDSEISASESFFVSLNLFRHRGLSSRPELVPFSLGMGQAWPEGEVEFLDSAGTRVGESRHVTFDDGC